MYMKRKVAKKLVLTNNIEVAPALIISSRSQIWTKKKKKRHESEQSDWPWQV